MTQNRIFRLIIALCAVAFIGAQIPLRSGTAMAQDSYPCNNNGRFGQVLTATLIGLAGANLIKLGKRQPTVPDVIIPVPDVKKPCPPATLGGDANSSIYDVLRRDPQKFSGITGLVDDCDELMLSLKNDEPFTFLAPENDIIRALSPQTVAQLRSNPDAYCEFLKNHTIIGRYKYEDLCRLMDGKKLLTLSGNTLELRHRDGKVYLQGVEVLPYDLAASNGWIHPIRGIVRP